MIEIDGKESGGQTLRSSLSLSAYTGKSFKILNIRGKRQDAGLKHQHLAAVNAAAKICNAEVKGAVLGSTKLEFKPNEIKADKYRFTIGTAGSALLVLQTILPVLLKANEKSIVKIGGGTDNPQAPGSFYFMHIFNNFLSKLGIDHKFQVIKHGFYPRGDGLIESIIMPVKEIKEINLVDRGNLINIDGHAIATNDLMQKNVAERMCDGFKKNFPVDLDLKCRSYYISSLSIGCFMHAHLHYENFKVGDDVLGHISKKSEDVGKELANKIKYLMNAKGVDHFAADQLMVYMGIKGKGKVLTNKITDHIKTNASVIEKFLPVRFKIENNLIECGPVV